MIEYGNAIKDLVAANIFPGDMLWKNFGVTRHGKVVFYDYDEIEYLTECNFRRVPAPRNEEDEMSGELWYSVGPHDVFPETFAPFLLGNPAVREVFMKHHADLLDAAFWQSHKSASWPAMSTTCFPTTRRSASRATAGRPAAPPVRRRVRQSAAVERARPPLVRAPKGGTGGGSRTAQGSAGANGSPPRGEDQSNRDESARRLLGRRAG